MLGRSQWFSPVVDGELFCNGFEFHANFQLTGMRPSLVSTGLKPSTPVRINSCTNQRMRSSDFSHASQLIIIKMKLYYI